MSRFLASIALLLSCVATAGAAAPPLGRLHDGVRPTAYRLDLTIDPAAPRFTGHAEIDAVLKKPAASIFLHGNGLAVTRAGVMVAGEPYAARYAEVDASGVAKLDFARKVPAGRITLSFDYSAAFRDTPEGLFRAKVGELWYAWTQFEAIDARRAFPCFDEPGFKTPFTVMVSAPAILKVFGNAPELSKTIAGSLVVHRFATTQPLPTYLVALGVGRFDVIVTEVPPNAVRKEPLPFRVIATRGQEPRMRFAAAEGPKLLALLETYFGTAYPYEKLDFMASPLQQGAMENAGLIIYGDSLILQDDNPTLRQVRSFGTVAAHEMAHQWFGDLVTPTWWTDIWLNESFAEWMGNKIAGEWRPELGIAAAELASAFHAMDADALGRGRPIHQEIRSSKELSSAFDSITYLKGAQVLSMFESYLGADTFAKGVREHLAAHRHGSATAQDFFAALGGAAGNPKLVGAMKTFIDQTGIPVVSVAAGAENVTLAQKRYRPLGVPATADPLWSVPMCLSRGEARTCTLLDKRSASIAAPMSGVNGGGAALMPNANGAGYYRFSLDGPGWDSLIAVAAELPGREAMALADNLWADFAAGGTDFKRVVAAARALSANPERLAAIELAYRLKGIADTMLKPDELPGYRRLMGSIYAPRLAELGDDVAAGAYAAEPAPRRALRESLLSLVALQARDTALRVKLRAAAVGSLAGAPHALDPAFRAVALQVAVQDGDAAFLAQLKDAVLKSSDPQFRRDAVIAIGSADTAALAEAALAAATAPDMAKPEASQIVFSLSHQSGARDVATAFARDNFAKLMELVSTFARPYTIELFAGYCDATAAAGVDSLFRPRLAAMGGGELILAQTRETITLCATLKGARGAEIAAALAN